jgi:hypothetical protein
LPLNDREECGLYASESWHDVTLRAEQNLEDFCPPRISTIEVVVLDVVARGYKYVQVAEEVDSDACDMSLED